MTVRSTVVAWSVVVAAISGSAIETVTAQVPVGMPHIRDVYAGDCAVVIELSQQRPGDVIGVQLDLANLEPMQVSKADQATVELPTTAPLQKGQDLRVSLNGSEVVAARTTAKDQTTRPPGRAAIGTCVEPAPAVVDDATFVATAYYGTAFDTFAPASIGGYPPDTATSTKNQQLFGIDFEYQFRPQRSKAWQFWLSGETLHGVRSADISCTTPEEKKSPLCTPVNGVQYAQQVLTHQTSLEAHVAPTLAFVRLQPGSTTPAWLYATARLGFIAMADAPRVYKSFHVGLGLRAAGGTFDGTKFELGWGNNELFSGPRWKRLKVDGLLSFGLDAVPGVRDKARFFIEMYVDNDVFGDQADSIQTFMGFDFDVQKFFGR